MKILQSSDDMLEISDFPVSGVIGGAVAVIAGLAVVVAGAVLQGIALGLAGVISVILFYQRSHFLFDCEQQKLFWERRTIRGRVAEELPFAEITGVTCESVDSPEKHRVVIRATDREIPVSPSFSSGAQKRCEEVKHAIEAILQNDTALSETS